MIETGHRYEIECIDLSVEGDGIGRQEDRVVFVPDLLPGEKALVHITRQNRRILKVGQSAIIDESAALCAMLPAIWFLRRMQFAACRIYFAAGL